MTYIVPQMDWNAVDKIKAWEIDRLTLYLTVAKATKGEEWGYILMMVGEEGSLRWEN